MPPIFSKPLSAPGQNPYQCWNDALYKLLTLPEHAPATRHRLMSGSLRFRGMKKELWGGSDEYIDANPSDSHTWIEDEAGRVWDWIMPEVGDSRRTNVPPGGLFIDGLTKKEILLQHQLSYEPASDYIRRKVFNHAFIDGLPWKPRTDCWVDDNDKRGYIMLRTAPRNLVEQKTSQYMDARRQMGEIFRDLNAPGLLEGDTATLQRWREFYADPLAMPSIAAIISIFLPTGGDFSAKVPLDDSFETEMLLKHGLIYPRFHARFKSVQNKLIEEARAPPTREAGVIRYILAELTDANLI